MIALYLFTGTFLVIFFIFFMFFIVRAERKAKETEQINKDRFDELTRMINDTQRLFRNEVTDILKQFENLLK